MSNSQCTIFNKNYKYLDINALKALSSPQLYIIMVDNAAIRTKSSLDIGWGQILHINEKSLRMMFIKALL